MNNIIYTKPTLKMIPKMQKLVEDEVKNGIILKREDDEVATNIRSYIIATNNDELVGYGALHIHSMKLAEIRSLVVGKNFQGKGIGKKLVFALLDEAKKLDVKEVFTLTYQVAFFEKLGFHQISKENLPNQKIWLDCIKCKHFPVCDEISLIIKL